MVKDMRYKAFIFDIDGTLTDSGPIILNALQKILKEQTGRTWSFEELHFCLGLPNTELGSYFHIDNWMEVLENGRKYYDEQADKICLFEGISEVVKFLSDKGACLGLVTSKLRAQYERSFRRYPLSSCFSCCVCADEAKAFKPDPAPLFKCMELLGVSSSETLYIGDAKNDMLCARAAGVHGALALWGSRKANDIDADYYLTDPEELKRFI